MICLQQSSYLLGMAMELRHLRYFIAVAEEGHITRAAERLGIEQPPLSKQIKAIEREMGVQLFHRRPRGVDPTDAGRVFLEDARATLANLDHAVEAARRTARGEQGRLSVGYTSAAAFHPLVARAIRDFRDAFPLVSVTLSEGFPYDLVERMRNDQVDVAFIRTPIADPQGMVIEPLQKETVVVALPNRHALARTGGNTSLPLKALSGETFIMYGRPDGALTLQSNAIVMACQGAGFNPRIGHVVPQHLSTLNLVAAGLGVAVVSTSLRRMNVEGVSFHRLKGAAQIKIPLDLASRRGDTSAVVRQFRISTRRTARNFRAD